MARKLSTKITKTILTCVGKDVPTTEYYDEYGEDDYDANAIYGQQKKFAPQSAVAHKKVYNDDIMKPSVR